MRCRRKFAAGLVLFALFGGVAACSPSTGHMSTSQGTLATAVPTSVNEVDMHFIAMMTPHHEQAVQMSDIVLAAQDVSPQTKDIAQRIKDGQQTEIDQMLEWADQWGMSSMMSGHSMHVANGILTADQLATLESLTGPEVERVFLEQMIYHHEGAMAMTQGEVDGGGFTELTELAQYMIEVQSAEVIEMNRLLIAL